MSDEVLQAMPEAHQEIIHNMPAWILVVFGIVVFSGAVGSLTFLLKKKIANNLFFISLVGYLMQLGRSVVEKEFEVYGTAEIVVTAMIIGTLIFAIWLPKYASTNNLIR